jgi:hypothetical protein
MGAPYPISNLFFMKFLVLFFCLLLSDKIKAQQQEYLLLDSCFIYAKANEQIAGQMVLRAQRTATWKQTDISIERFFEQFFKPYLQKNAGGNLKLSLLIDPNGHCCFFKVVPNSNVRPDYTSLKQQLDRSIWNPASYQESEIHMVKTLQIRFEGKKIHVSELD